MRMINKIKRYLQRNSAINRFALALGRGSATARLRTIDPANPLSWEFSAFSQNGEDGIIDYLTRKINNPNYYFIEIGASDGIENNTAWLAIARKYMGLMIEGDPNSIQRCKQIIPSFNLGVECIQLFVDKNNIKLLCDLALYKDPDLFSLDIDGNDYYIAQSVLDAGFSPKILAVEYNSVFGPTNALTIKYRKDFNYLAVHESNLYYGVSIAGWKMFFQRYGYQFVTVDRNGINAFFIKPEHFDSGFCQNIQGLAFRENFYQLKKFKVTWEKQFEMIKNMPFVEIKE